MRYAALGIIAIAAVLAIGFFILVRGPGPTDFAGGKRIALADYRHAIPRRTASPLPAGALSSCRSARSIRPTSRPTRIPASVPIPTRIS
jgi:hypothetical protein